MLLPFENIRLFRLLTIKTKNPKTVVFGIISMPFLCPILPVASEWCHYVLCRFPRMQFLRRNLTAVLLCSYYRTVISHSDGHSVVIRAKEKAGTYNTPGESIKLPLGMYVPALKFKDRSVCKNPASRIQAMRYRSVCGNLAYRRQNIYSVVALFSEYDILYHTEHLFVKS